MARGVWAFAHAEVRVASPAASSRPPGHRGETFEPSRKDSWIGQGRSHCPDRRVRRKPTCWGIGAWRLTGFACTRAVRDQASSTAWLALDDCD